MLTLQKLLSLLSAGQRRAATLLLGLMLIGMVLEMLGVGLVIPVLMVMTRSDLAAEYPVLEPWLARLGRPSQEQLVVGSMLVLVGIALTKALFLGFLAWWGARFAFALQADVSQRLFAGYLRLPWTFHLRRNSAQLIRNALQQVDQVRAAIQTGLLLIAELLVLIGVGALLLAVEPAGTLWVVLTLGLAGWGFQLLTRDRLLRWGLLRQLHEGLRIQHLQQGLGGAKDVKLLGREDDFIARYQVHNAANAHVGQRQATIQRFPTLWFELLAVSGLGILVTVLVSGGSPPGILLPTLGLFAAAAFRLLPSASRVLSSVQTLRYSVPVIDNLYDELVLIAANTLSVNGPPLALESTLTVDRVDFRYEDTEALALHGVSLSVPRGTSAGIIGTTGAGKSTLVDIILGLLTPSDGAVRVNGVDIQTSLRGWQDGIGYVPQSIFLTDDTLRRNIAFGVPDADIGEDSVRRTIQAAQLEALVDDLPKGLDTVVGERGVRLSGGQRQRIGIARALFHSPSVLILDEATSALDMETERSVMEAVRALQGDKTVIIVAHRLSTVESCDRIFRLEHGRLVEEGAAAVVLGTISRTD